MNTDRRYLPFVSALIVTRNEHLYIDRALLSLIHQTYPKSRYEIIVIDGESNDDTMKIVDRIIRQYRTETFDIRVISNPRHILSTGWNLGIRNAKGEYVVRIDAHATAEEDFIEKSVDTILSVPDAVCVGGKLTTCASENSDPLVSMVLSSSFGVGNSSFRVSDSPGYTDTAVYGLYLKSIFEQIGYFNEQYVRNQDIELHSRIRKAGHKIYYNPEIQSVYYTRNNVKKMVQQAYGNGKWNMVLLKKRSSALQIRHLVPFLFVIYLIISTILGFVTPLFWLQEILILFLHFALGIVAATRKTNKIPEILKMSFLFFLLHAAYGVGYLSGLFIQL